MPLDTTTSDLYPELEAAGGLPRALQALLGTLSGGLVVESLDEPFIVYAQVRKAPRSSQVMIAAHHRAFSADFWNQGVQFGIGWAASLEDVAAAIHAFLVEGVNAAALQSRFAWVGVSDQAFAHERGPAAFVDEAWQSHVDWLGREPDGSLDGRLLPLVRACMQRPRLRRLMPFTSHGRLCFSRTTGFPYTSECPAAFATDDGRFRLERGDGGAREGAVEGDAASVAMTLEARLASDCPAAYHGTAVEART